MDLEQLQDYILSKLDFCPNLIIENHHDILHVNIDYNFIKNVLLKLRDDENCQFKTLVSICGVDYVERENRFEIVYSLLSYTLNKRLLIKIQVNENIAVDTVSGIYSSAEWYEREIWDMYGVIFADHPDMRRILTDYGFSGHPLRKDFPLSGHVQVYYNKESGKVMHEPVKLDQEYRDFDFETPWEGVRDKL